MCLGVRSVLHGKMARDVAGVVENTDHLDHAPPQAVDDQMSRLSHHAEGRPGPGAVTAEADMIDEHVLGELRALPHPRPFGIFADVSKRLAQQGVVPPGSVLAELAAAPKKRRGYIPPRGPRDAHFVAGMLSHASA